MQLCELSRRSVAISANSFVQISRENWFSSRGYLWKRNIVKCDLNLECVVVLWQVQVYYSLNLITNNWMFVFSLCFYLIVFHRMVVPCWRRFSVSWWNNSSPNHIRHNGNNKFSHGQFSHSSPGEQTKCANQTNEFSWICIFLRDTILDKWWCCVQWWMSRNPRRSHLDFCWFCTRICRHYCGCVDNDSRLQ